MIRRRRSLRLMAVLGLLCGLIGWGSGPALAAGEIGLSTDGVHWSAALPGTLFDPAFRWVPGDVQTRTFYVRNQDSTAAVMDITMLTGPVATLLDTGDLTIGARVDGGAYTSATTAGTHLLVDQVPVESGAVKKIDVQVSFDPASTNQSQLTQFDLRFTVQLSQATAVLPPTTGGNAGPPHGGGTVAGPTNSGGSGSGSGDLPGTGSVITPTLLAEAVLLIGAGFFLVGWARRRRTEGER